MLNKNNKYSLELVGSYLGLCVNGELIPNQISVEVKATASDPYPRLVVELLLDDSEIRLGRGVECLTSIL